MQGIYLPAYFVSYLLPYCTKIWRALLKHLLSGIAHILGKQLPCDFLH